MELLCLPWEKLNIPCWRHLQPSILGDIMWMTNLIPARFQTQEQLDIRVSQQLHHPFQTGTRAHQEFRAGIY